MAAVVVKTVAAVDVVGAEDGCVGRSEAEDDGSGEVVGRVASGVAVGVRVAVGSDDRVGLAWVGAGPGRTDSRVGLGAFC